MYQSFYGLTDKPFQLNPDPSFYFGSREHRRAMAYLEYGLHQNEGFIVVTGDVGTGKTTLIRSLLSKLDPKKVVAAQLVSTQLDAEDTLRLVCAAFGLPAKDIAKSDALLSLEKFLRSLSRDGKRALLIIDEAQNLAPRAVEELRMLSNFQVGTNALVQSFLVGQPEFRETMCSPHMQQLRQRVIASCHISPLSSEDTKGYVEHRLRHAGWTKDPIISDDAYETIFKYSGGTPRRINTLCDRLLLSGFLNDSHQFAAAEVENVAKEMMEETFSSNRSTGTGSTDDHPNPRAAIHQMVSGSGRAILGQGNLTGNLSKEQALELLAGLQADIALEKLSQMERSLETLIQLLKQFIRTEPEASRNSTQDNASKNSENSFTSE
ncbi:MAG: AAA family ATPase [Rhodocyclaceae bacterium]|nr:AAA family ATPase [Rhodocyclaceae bacterium]